VDDIGNGILLALAASFINKSAVAMVVSQGWEVKEEVVKYFKEVHPTSQWQVPITVLGIVANSFGEELTMRSFLIVRLTQLLKSPILAVILTSSMFAAYHLYQGVGPAFGVLFVGLVFGTYFAFSRRIAPLLIAHTIMNLVVTFNHR